MDYLLDNNGNVFLYNKKNILGIIKLLYIKPSLKEWEKNIKDLSFLFYNNDILIDLVKERGISILHEYFSHIAQEGYLYHIDKNNEYFIDSRLNTIFCYIKQLIDKNLLWNPTVIEFIEYHEQLLDILIYMHDNKILIINNSQNIIKSYSLWIYNKINTIIIVNEKKIFGNLDYNNEYIKFQFDLLVGENYIYYE